MRMTHTITRAMQKLTMKQMSALKRKKANKKTVKALDLESLKKKKVK